MPADYDVIHVKPDVAGEFRDINKRMRAATGRRVTLSVTLAAMAAAWHKANERWPGLPDFDDEDTNNSADES